MAEVGGYVPPSTGGGTGSTAPGSGGASVVLDDKQQAGVCAVCVDRGSYYPCYTSLIDRGVICMQGSYGSDAGEELGFGFRSSLEGDLSHVLAGDRIYEVGDLVNLERSKIVTMLAYNALSDDFSGYSLWDVIR